MYNLSIRSWLWFQMTGIFRQGIDVMVLRISSGEKILEFESKNNWITFKQ